MRSLTKRKIRSLIICLVIMAILLFLFKFLPMRFFGDEILFDASMHIVVASFILYLIWFFIDKNKSWKIPYLLFSIFVLFVISIQRLLANAHNDVGLLAGLIISIVSIVISNWHYFHKKISF